jgi:hypothetical protein
MKRNLLVFSLIIAAVFAMSSCKKDKLVDVNGIVSGKVTNPTTNLGVAGVKVSVAGISDTAMTASDGTYKLNNVPSGTIRIFFIKSGYLTQRADVKIEQPDAISTSSKTADIRMTQDMTMYPLTGQVKGQVTQSAINAAGTSNITIAAASATVFYAYGDTVFTTTTDANGYYAFNNLPVFSNNYFSYSLIASKGIASGSGSGYFYPLNSNNNNPINIYISEVNIAYVSSNCDAFVAPLGIDASTTALTLNFTQNVALTQTSNKGSVTLKNTTANTTLATTLSVSGNTLIVTPTAKLSAASSYTMSGTAYASDVKSTPFSVNFTTK